MSGIVKYLLDTHIVIGMYGLTPAVLTLLANYGADTSNAGISPITRIELLCHPDLTDADRSGLEAVLSHLVRYALDPKVEDAAIAIRRATRTKTPDAIILAPAQVHGLQLLTLDQRLATLAAKT